MPARFAVTLSVLVSLSACAAGPEDPDEPEVSCDDGQCDQQASCHSTEQCPTDALCVRGDCQPAFPGKYLLELLGFQVPSLTSAGGTWDPLDPTEIGKQPDPLVVVILNGEEVLTTTPVNDATLGMFSHAALLELDKLDNLSFEVYDSDIVMDDLMFLCVPPLLAHDVDKRVDVAGMHCSEPAGGVTMRLRPEFSN